jgi:superfamily II DNA helicase RecQ
LVLTATAAPAVLDEIVERLGMDDPTIMVEDSPGQTRSYLPVCAS